MTKENRKKLALLRYHYGHGHLTFQQFHNRLLPLYEKGVQ